jgi:hypothetical protein
MTRTPKIHTLRDNKAERSPARLIVLDTETQWRISDGRELHTLRCWVARTIVRNRAGARTEGYADFNGTDAGALADHIDAQCDGLVTTWLFAHNLGFDLIVTRLVLLLLDRGWVIGRHALTLDSPWLQMSHGRRRLTMADSFSWLPTSVERLGRELGIDKPALPDNADTLIDWLERCAADVAITAAALEQLLDWWDRNRLGCWSLTGAATGWNAYRHRRETSQVTIDPDPDGRAFERRAINAGRREVWRTGELPRSRYVEIDLERAHLTAARCFLLPQRRGNAFGPIPLDDVRLRAHQYAPIAEVTVSTETPRYPLVAGGRTWYPVGTFRTILCGPEIAEAQRRGELVAVHRGIIYRNGATMTRWAHWVAAMLDGNVDDVPPMAMLAAKSWSRRVPGKWATRTSQTLETLPSIEQGWRIERGVHHPSGHRCTMLHLGGSMEVLLQDQEADDSFPAVLAWVQSLTRVAISRLVDHFGDARMVSVNTDGIIVRAQRGPNLDHLATLCAPFTPRVKGVYHTVEVLSPQHLILDGKPRLSGIPQSAGAAGGSSYAWQTWPSFSRQLEQGSTDGYLRDARTVHLDHVPVNRWRLEDGSTRPPRAAPAGPGGPRWVHPYSDPSWPAGAALSPAQHPMLAKVPAPLMVP